MRQNLQSVLILGILIIVLSSFTKASFTTKKAIVCSEFTEKYTDQVTGIKRFIAKEKIGLNDHQKKNSFDLIWFKTKSEYTLAFKAISPLCFENDVAVSFHLLEGKVITCASSHIANCESLMTVNFESSLESREKIDLLSNSQVVGISFENEGKEYKLKVRQRQARLFQQTVDCLVSK